MISGIIFTYNHATLLYISTVNHSNPIRYPQVKKWRPLLHFVVFILFLSLSVSAQSIEEKALERTVYRYNNAFHYDSSKRAITAFLNRTGVTAENRFYAYLFLSYTYKRLFDYPANLLYLDSARWWGQQTARPDFFVNNIACQKAFAFFDIHQYSRADTLMQQLRQQGYRHLDGENQSKIMMQEAYLLFLQKDYKVAEGRYRVALAKMQASSPCDAPMIFGKLIELYGAMQAENKMLAAYHDALKSSDSCGIVKYRLYAAEQLTSTLENRGRYREAIFFARIRDSLANLYNTQNHRDKLLQLEARHREELSRQQISLQQKTIESKNLFITLLVVGIVAIAAAVMYSLQRLRQKKLRQEQENTQRYTRQLLQKTEEDRRRIAGHLHDGINHELLTLKNTLPPAEAEARNRIDLLIEDVRHISHHLHPVVFNRVGLSCSLAQLAERVQEKNKFLLTADVDYNKALSNEAELQVYRIVQEAVTNMLRHSGAVAGKIILRQLPAQVWLEIKDSGRGFAVPETLNSSKSFGLQNIVERGRAAGGQVIIRSDSSGTVIRLKIPLATV